MDVVEFLGPVFIAGVIFTGIHCYLGLHVLKRNIVFVDLALAQSAGFGLALSFLLDLQPGSPVSYLMALSGALTASVLFTLMDSHKKISQEAFIGIVYAFFSVLVILLFDKAPHGAEHIKHIFAGQLIWITYSDVIQMFFIYAVVSAIYFVFHKPLWETSIGKRRGWKWNMLFYSLFSVVIAGSVSTAGVLLVFSFLIVPAFLSGFFFQTLRKRLIFGWTAGILLTAFGLTGSYTLNFPTSAFLVFLFTLAPIVLFVGIVLKKQLFLPFKRNLTK